MSQPKFSILIVNWNGLSVLPRCFEALESQDFHAFEVVLLDNGSSDGSAAYVRREHPEVMLIESNHNRGFAAGNNLAANAARGEWLVLLNNDAFPAPDWLCVLDQATRDFPDAAMFASRLLMADDPGRIDGTGDALHVSGSVWNRQHRHPAHLADAVPHEVFSPQGAAAVILRAAFESAGGFDEDFFAYHEDIDLAFRLRLLGHHCMYIPDALVYHKGSHTTGRGSDFAVEHGHRNWVWCWWQNMPGPLVLRYFFEHVLASLFFILYISIKGQPTAILKARWRAFLGMPHALRKRRRIQSTRTASVRQVHAALEKGFFTPYIQGVQARRLAGVKTLKKAS